MEIRRDFSAEEIPDYVRHKIRVAGGADSIINHAAMASVHSLSQGNPRIIDTLMTDILVLGAQMGKKIIDADVIKKRVAVTVFFCHSPHIHLFCSSQRLSPGIGPAF